MKRAIIIFLILISIAFLLRVLYIRADAPLKIVHLTNSGGIYFDEGIYPHNARNKILFGKWVTDEWNPIIYSFILNYLYYIVFLLFGIGIVQIKMVHVVISLFFILFFYLSARKEFGERFGLLFSTIPAFSFVYLIYNRNGLVENVMTLLFMIAFYFFLLSLEKEKYSFWNGFFTSLAFITKYYGIYFVIADIVAILYAMKGRPNKKKSILLFASGFLTTIILWFLFIFLPFRENYLKISGGWTKLSRPPLSSPLELLSNLDRFIAFRYFSLSPVLLILGIIFVTFGIYKLIKWDIKPSHLFVLLWLLIGSAEIGILYYHPLRYFVPIYPAFFLASAYALHWIFFEDGKEKIKPLPAGITFLVLIYLLYKAQIFLLHYPKFPDILMFKFFSLKKFYASAVIYINIAIAGIILAAFLFRLIKPVKLTFAVFLFAIIPSINSLYLFNKHFLSHPEYKVEQMADYVKTHYSRSNVFMGLEAPRIILKTRMRVVFAYKDWYNDKNDPFRRFRVTHLVDMRKFHQLWWVKSMYPRIFKNLELEVSFPIWDTYIDIYRIKWENLK